MPFHPKTAVKGRSGESGPLKRTGQKAHDWDMLVGPSLDNIPGNQLPSVKTVLQRYQGLRIQAPTATKASLAKEVSTEVKAIWERARVPTISDHNIVRKVLGYIEKWNGNHNPGENVERIASELSALCDLAPKLRGKFPILPL